MDDSLKKKKDAEPASSEPRVRGDLTEIELHRGARPGDAYVRVVRADSHLLHRVAPGYLRATEEVSRPEGTFGRLYVRLKSFLVGRPLPTEAEVVQ